MAVELYCGLSVMRCSLLGTSARPMMYYVSSKC